MDERHSMVCLKELSNQIEAFTLGCQEFNAQLNSNEMSDSTVPRIFAASQSILAAAAMISKMLWPPSTSSPARDRGKALRRQLNIAEGEFSVLKDRDARNGFEHFDELLDDWLERETGYLVDRNIVDDPASAIVINGAPALHVRMINKAALTINVLDRRPAQLQQMAHEVADLDGRIRSALSTLSGT